MDQIHRRFSTDQIRNLLRGYTEGLLERPAIEELRSGNETARYPGCEQMQEVVFLTLKAEGSIFFQRTLIMERKYEVLIPDGIKWKSISSQASNTSISELRIRGIAKLRKRDMIEIKKYGQISFFLSNSPCSTF